MAIIFTLVLITIKISNSHANICPTMANTFVCPFRAVLDENQSMDLRA
jgi:hypothetical protein